MLDARGHVDRAAIRSDVQMFRRMLESRFGNLVAGWRGALDKDGSGGVSLEEFLSACRRLRFPGDARAVFDALADDEELSLHALDKEAAELLSEFAVFIRDEFGTVEQAFTSGLAWSSRKASSIDFQTFLHACLEMRFRSHNFRRLFDCLDYNLDGDLNLVELKFLEVWKADMFVPVPSLDERLAEALRDHRPLDEICILVEQGASPNRKHNIGQAFTDDGHYALAQAVERGTVEHVRRLLACRADANMPDVYGRTPLHAAAARPEARVDPVLLIDCLAAAHADPNARTGDGTTPLHVACGAGHAAAVSRLAHVGAYVHMRDALNRSPLWITVFRKSSACCNVLLEFLADPCRPDKGGRTALTFAIETRQTVFVNDFRAHVQSNFRALVQAAERELGEGFDEMRYRELLPDAARLTEALQVGDYLEARASDGTWWPVTVTRRNDDGTYECGVHDGGGTVWSRVYASNMRQIKVHDHYMIGPALAKAEVHEAFQRPVLEAQQGSAGRGPRLL